MTDHWWNPVLRIYTIYINYMPDKISASNGCWAIITWKNILIISMGRWRDLFYNMRATGQV